MLVWWCAVVAAVKLAWPVEAVVGGQPAAAPEPDAAVVFVQKHGLSARLEGLKDERLGYYSFFGLRYVEPPLGQRRFQRPVRRFMSGDVSAKQGCLPCPQPDPWDPRRIIGHEDCLCLNVFAPKMPGEEEGSPVVFFIHGGDYQRGSAAPYGGQYLTQKDTILVIPQYRLGSLGYFSTAEKDASGNAGLFDLRAAMNWVRDYIEFFGGDSKRVVVMGQGSGGSAASLLALSNKEGRSATGVAALSGVPLSPGAVRTDPAKYATELAKKTGCPESPAEVLLKCLRETPMEKIVMADNAMKMNNVNTEQFLNEISGRTEMSVANSTIKVEFGGVSNKIGSWWLKEKSGPEGAGARVEGGDDLRALPPLVAESPAEALNKKQQNCPLLTGVNSAETSRAVFGKKYSGYLTNQLSTVKDFIKNEMIGGLKDAVQGVQGLVSVPLDAVQQIIPLPDYYSALFDSSLSAIDGLSQIVEATSDALFNFPAYQTVQEWSAGSPAYLYSFEHVGNLSKGSHFLPGMALTDDRNINMSEEKSGGVKGPAHGDELAYIFQALDDKGKPIEVEPSVTDQRVRDNFVSLISQFAHDLSPMKNNNDSKSNLLPFSKNNNDQFIKIREDITLDKDFRFCQMGLWGNMADRITGALCQNVLGNLLKLPKLPFPTKLKPPVPLPIKPPLPGVNNLLGNTGEGLLGSQKTEPPKVIQVPRQPSTSRRGLGGLLNGL